MKCRFCHVDLKVTFVDLGITPLANSLLSQEKLSKGEKFYPLHVYVCQECFLVQLDEFESPQDIFSDYLYFSSYSQSWLEHAKHYVELMLKKLSLSPESYVVEVASNDGYLLQFFREYNIPVLGIEPATNIANVAIKKGIPTLNKFFGVQTAELLLKEGKQADLLLGNNVLAHVPDLDDFIGGLKLLLKPSGVITLEFPHLLQLLNQNQFDTICHEHFSYFSLIALENIFNSHQLLIFDVEELPTHGGSLRIYIQHTECSQHLVSKNVSLLKKKEIDVGLEQIGTYKNFNQKVQKIKRNLLSFLIDIKNQEKSIVGYGAPAKGNTLLNYCGIGTDFLDYTVDASPYKQGLFLPGTRIPIFEVQKIKETKPDFILLLPWNLKSEIIRQMEFVREWNCKFIVPIPDITIF